MGRKRPSALSEVMSHPEGNIALRLTEKANIYSLKLRANEANENPHYSA